MSSKPILIIDGNALVYKSLINKKDGEKPLGFRDEKGNFIRTGMPYSFLVNLIFLVKEFDPKNMIIVWDGGSDRRIKIFPEYKKARKEKYAAQKIEDEKYVSKNKNNEDYIPPFDFKEEISKVFNIAKHLGVEQYKTRGEEGDDLIATIISKIPDNEKIIICSNDHDFKQLLQRKNVSIFFSLGFKKIKHNYKSFVEKFGFEPKFYRNFLALCGDNTDGYFGIPKIGDKRACILINEYGPTLKKIFKNAEKNNIKIRGFNNINSEIISNKNKILLNKKIATLYENCILTPVDSTFNITVLKNIFKEYRFHSMMFDDKIESIRNIPRKKLDPSSLHYR